MAPSLSATSYFRRSYIQRWILLFCVTSSSLVRAAEPLPPLKNGADFSKALQATVGFTWSESELREGLGNLAKECGVAVWIDRRVDPDRRLTFQVRDVSLENALYQLVVAEQLSYATLGNVIYVGPPEKQARLQGVLHLRRQELAGLSAAARAKWNAQLSMNWSELAEPRELVTQFADKLGAKCDDLSAVPHDLWPAWRSPSLTGVELLSLLLIGFDRTFQLSPDGRSFRIVPIPATLSYEQTYSIPGDVVQVGKDLKRILPEVSLKREGTSKIVATATAEDHAKIAELLAGKKVVTKTIVKPAEKRYTLNVENQPRGAVAKTIAKELGVPLQFDPAWNEKLTERVTLSVKQVTAEELLRQLLEPAGLRAVLGKEALEIVALKKEE